MRDHFHPPPLDRRDVIAAWMLCFAVAAPGFLYSEIAASAGEAAGPASAASPQASPPPGIDTLAAQTDRPRLLCAVVRKFSGGAE